MSTAESFVIPSDDTGIAVYSEFRAQLATLDAENRSLVFDYEDQKGNKAARSHIHKLRRTKSAVDAARKAEKAASLEYGRRVDAEAKEIIGQIENMIEVHATPIREIEEREEARKADILRRVGILCSYSEIPVTLSSVELRERLDELEAIEIDESYAESMAVATTHKREGIEHLTAAIEAAEKREAEAAELERLRAEADERERKEREERIAAEAAAKAEAEAKAAKEREEAAKARAEKAEKEAAEAAERAAAEAEARVRREVEEAEQAEKAAAAQREKNRKHRDAVNTAAAEKLTEVADLSDAQALLVVSAIANGEIPAISIAY